MGDLRRSNTYSYSSSGNNVDMQQIQPYHGPCDYRSYSTSSYPQTDIWGGSSGSSNYYIKEKKKKSSSVSSSSWGLTLIISDPAELQRKKRVASYKMYGMEGKLKASFTNTFRWIKNTYTHMLYGRRNNL